jgi:zinc/manganese transport system substrate-binding protein
MTFDHIHRCRFLGALVVLAGLLLGSAAQAAKLKVVATLPSYGSIAEAIAGELGEVRSLARGYEDPHFVRPKPSLALIVGRADLLISTGLDLELWLPALLDKANNPRVRSGQPGFVAASHGIYLLEKPRVVSRSEGDVHVYGNPHVYIGPLNLKIIARNIMVGLKKVDPEHAATYEKNYEAFKAKLDRRLFGDELIKILGPTVLTKLTLAGKLVPFLEKRSFKGGKLIDRLGGWMKQALPLRGRKIVAYHKNWAYFARTFGVEIVDYVEPKPGLPPTPSHVAHVIAEMREKHVHVIMAANYFDSGKVKSIAEKVGARAVILPLGVGGEPAAKDVFSQFDLIIRRLVEAFAGRGG